MPTMSVKDFFNLEWELKADKISMKLTKEHYMHIAPLLPKQEMSK
jgi:hypothetical protein